MNGKPATTLVIISTFLAIIGLIGCSQPSSGGGGAANPPPAEVTLETQEITSATSLEITWTDPADDDFNHVEITFGIYGSGTPAVLTVPAGEQAFAVFGLETFSTYEIIIRTVDDAGGKSTGLTLLMTPDASAVDETLPEIVSALPTDGATGVAEDSSFVVKFSEAMNEAQATDPTNYSISSELPDDPALASDPAITWDGVSESVTLEFAADLTASIIYTIVIDGSLTDLAGNLLDNSLIERTFSFTIVGTDTVATPSFSLPGGVYSSNLSIEITCSTAGATIYYETYDEGEVPPPIDESSTVYSAPISIDGDNSPLEITTKAFKSGLIPSEQVVSAYGVEYPQAFPPTILPTAETFSTDTSFTLDFTSPDDGVEYWYTIDYADDSYPDVASETLYNPASPPMIILDSDTESVTVQSVAIGDGYEESPVNSVSYGLEYPGAAAPVFSPEDETGFIDSLEVTLNCASELTVHYLVNGGAEQTMNGGESFTIDGDDVVTGAVEIDAWTTGDGLKTSSITTAVYYQVNALRGLLGVPAGDYGKDVILFLIPDSSFYSDQENWVNETIYEDVSGDVTFAVPTLDSGNGLLCAAASDDFTQFPSEGDSFGYYDNGTSLPVPVTLDSSEITGLNFSLKDDHDLVGTWHAVGPGVEYSTDWRLLSFSNTATGFENLGVPEQMGLMVAAWNNGANWIILRNDEPDDETPFDIYSWETDPDPDFVLAFPDGGEGFASEAAAYAYYDTYYDTPDYFQPTEVFNDYADLPVASAPSFFPPSGSSLVKDIDTVTFNHASEDAIILFTFDGSDPGYANTNMEDINSGDMLTLNGNVTLKALAFTETEKISDISTASYQVFNNAVSGTLSMPSETANVTIFLDDNEDFRDGWIEATTLVGATDGTAYKFFTDLEIGEYYICAATWSDQPTGPSEGDWFGAYSNSPVGLPTKIDLATPGQIGIDIELKTAPECEGEWHGIYQTFDFTLTVGLLEVAFDIEEGAPNAQDMGGPIFTWNATDDWFLFSDEVNDLEYQKWGWSELIADTQFNMMLYMGDDMDWEDPESVASVTENMVVATVYANTGLIPDPSDLGFSGGGSITINVDFSTLTRAVEVDKVLVALLNADDWASEGMTNRGADSIESFAGNTATYTFTNLDETEEYFVAAFAWAGINSIGGTFDPDPESESGLTIAPGEHPTVNLTLIGENDGEYSGTAATLSGTVDLSNMSSLTGVDIIGIQLENSGNDSLRYLIDRPGGDSLEYEFINLNPSGMWTLSYGYWEYGSWENEISRRISLGALDEGANIQNITFYDANDGAHPGGTGIHGSIDMTGLTTTSGLDIIDVKLRADSVDQELIWTVNYRDGDSLYYEFVNLNPALTWDMDVMARDNNWDDDFGRYWESPVALTSGSDITHDISLQPPEHDGTYTGSDVATLSGTVDVGSWGWSGSADYVMVTLNGVTDSIGSQNLSYYVGLDWDDPDYEYEFIWLDPNTSSSWTLSAIAYINGGSPVGYFANVTPTVSAGGNTYNITFSE